MKQQHWVVTLALVPLVAAYDHNGLGAGSAEQEAKLAAAGWTEYDTIIAIHGELCFLSLVNTVH